MFSKSGLQRLAGGQKETALSCLLQTVVSGALRLRPEEGAALCEFTFEIAAPTRHLSCRVTGIVRGSPHAIFSAFAIAVLDGYYLKKKNSL